MVSYILSFTNLQAGGVVIPNNLKVRWLVITMVMAAACLPCAAGDEPSEVAKNAPFPDQSLYIKVQLAEQRKVGALKTGDMVEGTLARDVYSAERKLFSAGSHVRLTVEGVERRPRQRSDHWPWIVNLLRPRHENFPVFKDARMIGPDGRESSIQVSLISVGPKFEVRAQKQKKKSHKPDIDSSTSVEPYGTYTSAGVEPVKKSGAPIMILEAASSGAQAGSADAGVTYPLPLEATIVPSGTPCRILLLSTVSASKSRSGDVVQARLLEPLLLNSRVVLPAGSVFEGKVVRRKPPRMLSRAGSIHLTFTEISLPDGNRLPVAATLAGAELSRGSHTRIDAEGQIRGERPGTVWMLINGGLSTGLAKGVDDSAQLIIEAIVSSATNASTAGVSRIVSAGASGIFLLTRRGRDVVLPRFTEMEIVLSRPLSLTPAVESTSAATANGR